MTLTYRPTRRVSPMFSDFNRLLDSVETATSENTWRPAAEVSRDEEGFRIDLDLPGVKRDDISISVEKSELSISGKRQAPAGEREILRSERLSGEFERRFVLGDEVDSERISARFLDGVLSVELKHKASIKPRQVEISG